MNCATHADQPAVAYCRTCGKALCANCTRPVKGVIYCEDCLNARMSAPAQPTTYQAVMDQGLGMKVAPLPPSGSGPNPTVAGILAGFFPFGVGAVYTGQYAKGLAHLGIFALLIAGLSAGDHSGSEALGMICGFGLAFFWVYQIIDNVRSARAIQAGLPAPDPYGIAATFGGGETGASKPDTSKIPIGAVVLILLGVLFLLNTLGLELGIGRFWPLILMFLGVWMFARSYGLMGQASCDARDKQLAEVEGFAANRNYPGSVQNVIASSRCQCPRCRSRRLMGPAVLFTVGLLLLLETSGHLGFGRTWPILLLVIGAVKLFQSSASRDGHISRRMPAPGASPGVPPNAPTAAPPDVPPPPVPPAPPAAPTATSEVNNG
jgi:hypothetical protein